MTLKDKIRDEIGVKLDEIHRLMGEIGNAGEGKFNPFDCPFEPNHFSLSQMFNGLGCWNWTCPLCNMPFEE